MSDFFSNLVARARAATPAIRPNLPSLFDSPREQPRPGNFNVVDIEKETPPIAARPSRPPGPQSVEMMASANEMQSSPDPASAPATPTEKRRAPEPELAADKPAPVIEAPPEPVASRTATHPSVQIFESSVAVTGAPEGVETAPPGVNQAIALPHAVDPAKNFPGAPPPFPSITEITPEPTMRAQITDAIVEFPGPVIPRRIARAQFQSGEPQKVLSASSDPGANDASPPIQVTIGRLEIRAVTPPTPAPAERPAAAPRLSLDDYLRGRNGGSS